MCSNQYLKTTIRQPPINQKLINTFVIVVYIQINSSSRSYSGMKKIRKTALKICKMSHLFLNYKTLIDGVYVIARIHTKNETIKANFPTLRFVIHAKMRCVVATKNRNLMMRTIPMVPFVVSKNIFVKEVPHLLTCLNRKPNTKIRIQAI